MVSVCLPLLPPERHECNGQQNGVMLLVKLGKTGQW